MKTPIIVSLLIASVVGENLFHRIATKIDDLNPKCKKATDLKCPRDDITFWLYTKSNQKGVQLDVGSLAKAPWSKGPLKFLVHGYSVNKDTAINLVLRPAYFGYGEYNIISVDWSDLGKSGCYLQAVDNVPTISKCVADFFNAVVKAHMFNSVHLLGHSMGAHIAAWASQHIPSLPRLTKFDPANPLFNSKNSRRGEAAFIDVYHSNIGLKGQKAASGDVDVYFNSGEFQPGCKCDTACSHLRSVQYFAASIPTPMLAFPCAGWDQYAAKECPVPSAKTLVAVGENIRTRKGVFMVFTNVQAPFIVREDSLTSSASFYGYEKTDGISCKFAKDVDDIINNWF